MEQKIKNKLPQSFDIGCGVLGLTYRYARVKFKGIKVSYKHYYYVLLGDEQYTVDNEDCDIVNKQNIINAYNKKIKKYENGN